ncbi:chorismate mutase [Streptomyces sp. P6-2-1]|uniref:chorismate mutase n=1 Tax=unclassified Streptomyces TaxID=2593676 RepID=UPI003D35D646
MTSLPETTTETPDTAPAATPEGSAAPQGPAAAPQGWARKPSTAPTGSIPEHEKMITDARERIDAIDDRIIGLIQERSAVSAVVQKARVEAGGRRVNLSREMEVLSHYRDALGKPGTALAMTLLELSRGRV